jgi:hypothetical protein
MGVTSGYKEFEDTKGVIRIRASQKNRQNQWPKEKVQKNKKRSTKHTYKTKDRVARTPLKTGSELMCSGRVSSSCSTSGTHCHLLHRTTDRGYTISQHDLEFYNFLR